MITTGTSAGTRTGTSTRASGRLRREERSTGTTSVRTRSPRTHRAAPERSRRRVGWLRLLVGVAMLSGLGASLEADAAGPVMQQEASAGEQEAMVNASSGSLDYAIEIELPPGPRGSLPPLALTYSSGSGDGLAGVGWHLTTGIVECSARFGPPDFADCEHYTLNGELLVGPSVDAAGVERFHTLSESFRRIRRLPGGAWEVTTTQGTRMLLGTTASSRVQAGDHTAQWHLDTVVDVFGNTASYTYETFSSDEPSGLDAGIAYLTRIDYAEGSREIRFVYAPRPDVVERFDQGFRQRMLRRLSEVTVRSGETLTLNNRLELAYAAPGDYTTHRSRLASVTRYGRDCHVLSAPPSVFGCRGLPPQTFRYTDTPATQVAQFVDDPSLALPGTFIQHAIESAEPNAQGLAFPDAFGMAWGDVDGDGLTDVIRADCYLPCDDAQRASGLGNAIHEVYLNNGEGWDATPDPAWSAALAALRYTAPSIRLTRPSTQGWGSPSGTAPYCQVELGAYEAGVYLGSDVEYVVPPRPLSISPHPVMQEDVREFGAPGNFRVADVDGDGRVDLILSARLGGVWEKMGGEDCQEVLDEATYHDAEIRVVFLNTGDPNAGGTGWQRASDLGHAGLEASMPPFSGLEFQDHMTGGGCAQLGWGGDYDTWALAYPGPPAEAQQNTVHAGGYCRLFVDYDAQLVELTGDGRLDLLVLVPEDPRFIANNVAVDWSTGAAIPACPTTVSGWDSLIEPPLPVMPFGSIGCHNPASTRAFVQVEDASGGYSWAPAPEFDLVSAPVGAPAHHSYLYFQKFGWPTNWQQLHHPSLKIGGLHTADVGVRLVDLNRDGLTDIVWKDPFLVPDESDFDTQQIVGLSSSVHWSHQGGPSMGEGVLLNTGRGWCASWLPAPSGCPEAVRYHLPAPLVLAETAGFVTGLGKYLGGALPTTNARVNFVDANGDGWMDVVRLGDQGATWLQSPGEPGGSVWRQDERFTPPLEAQVPAHLDHDGVIDWIGTPDGGTLLARSQSDLPDLLEEIDRGQGGRLFFAYQRDAMQVDDGLEAIAAADAEQRVAGSTDAGAMTRWSGQAVVTLMGVAGPNFFSPRASGDGFDPVDAITTFRYARPRWCPSHRSLMGFRVSESVAPDGASTRRHYYQSHGLVGTTSQKNTLDPAGRLLKHERFDWELAEGVSRVHPHAYYGRLRRSESSHQYGAVVGEETGAMLTTTYSFEDDPGETPAHGFSFVTAIEHDRPSGGQRIERIPVASANLDDWTLSAVAEESLFDDDGVLLARTVYAEHHQTITGAQTLEPTRIEYGTFVRGGVEPLVTPGPFVVERDYDAYGNLSHEIIDPDGSPRITSYCYDGDAGCAPGHRSHSMVVRVTDALGNSSRTQPHPVFSVPRSVSSDYVDEPGTLFEHDAFGRGIAEYSIPEGAPATIEGATLLSTTSYSDTAPQRVTVVEFANAARSEFQVAVTIGDGFGGVWKTIQQLPGVGGPTHLATLRASDPTTRTEYSTLPLSCGSDALCSARVGTEAPGRTTHSDALGRPTLEIDSDGAFSVFEYAATSLSAFAPPALQGERFDLVTSKDERGALTRVTLDGGRLVRTEECRTMLDPAATVLSGCDLPDTTYFQFDGAGDRTTTHDAVASASGAFDATGSHVLRFVYDALGRVVATHDPDGGRDTIEYDAHGQVHRTTNARSQARVHDYDGLGRLIHVSTPPGEPDVSIRYPDRQKSKQAEFALGAYWNSYFYDGFGRLARTETGVQGSMESRFEYDLLGRTRKIVHPVSSDRVRTAVGFEYEGRYLRRVCDLEGESSCASAPRSFVEDIRYDELGQIQSMRLAGGVRSFEYDADSRLRTRDRYEAGSSGSYWVERSMQDEQGQASFDEAGNLLSITGSSSLGDFDFSRTYRYDHRGRVAEWERSAAPGVRDFEYDALGNLINNSGRLLEYDDPERPHAVQSRSNGGVIYRYDADGNIESIEDHGSVRHYRFDSINRMRCIGTVAGGCDVLDVTYDLSGNRVLEKANGRIHRYAGQDFRYTEGTLETRESLIAVRVDGLRIATKTLRGGELAMIVPGTTLFVPTLDAFRLGVVMLLLATIGTIVVFGVRSGLGWVHLRASTGLAFLLAFCLAHPMPVLAGGFTAGPADVSYRWVLSDEVGSGLIELDESGDRISHKLFEPFGKRVDVVGLETQDYFAGHARSEQASAYYMVARWLDPETGRFMSIDPVILAASDPQSHNPYSYARNNPIKLADPTGRWLSDPGAPVQFPIRGDSWRGRHHSTWANFGSNASGNEDSGGSGGSVIGSFFKSAADALSGAFSVAMDVIRVFASAIDFAVSLVIGENLGLAWAAIFRGGDAWGAGPTGGFLPDSLSKLIRHVRGLEPNLNEDWKKNGMHAWHAGTNALLVKKLGLIGVPFIVVGGVLHETPVDWGSFSAELSSQGYVNHFIDSVGDLVANAVGVAAGVFVPSTDLALDVAIRVGDYVPGPGETDPRFGGGGAYHGNPIHAWGFSAGLSNTAGPGPP